MALFTDSSLITISDLEVYESTLSKIASTHNINIESKTAITLAAIGDRLLGRLMRAGGANGSSLNPVTAGQYSLVTLPPQTMWTLTLDNVVVTGPLKRWISYELLSQIFSEAYNVQLNDRFREKWLYYSARSKETEESLYGLGIGIVYQPLAQPAIAQVSQGMGALPAGLVTVQTTWVVAMGKEGSPSLLLPVTLPDSSSMSVTIVPTQSAPPAAAAGWNVYVGANGAPPARQNAAVLSLNATWTTPPTGFTAGAAAPWGQQPDSFVLDPQRQWRG
jgi:hypothetical protein